MERLPVDYEKVEYQKIIVIRILYWFMILGLCFLGAKYILPVALPFVIAYLIGWAIDRPVTWLTKKTHIPRGIVATLAIILLTLIVSGLLILIGSSLVSWIKEGLILLPEFIKEGVFPFIERFFIRIEEIAGSFAPDVGSNLGTTVDGLFQLLSDSITKLSGTLLSALGGVLTGVPGVVVRTVITVIASIFITADFKRIKRFMTRLVPQSFYPVLKESGIFFGRIVPKYLLAYLLILLITFSELWIGLGILGVPKAPFIAFFIAVLDILPVLGTGAVVIPWGILSLISGDIKQGVFLLVLYVIITLIRQTIEPRLVGRQIGVHPVLTFAGMLFGVKFFGFVGLIGIPLLFAFLKQLHDCGVIHLGVLDKEDEAEDPPERKKKVKKARTRKNKAAEK